MPYCWCLCNSRALWPVLATIWSTIVGTSARVSLILTTDTPLHSCCTSGTRLLFTRILQPDGRLLMLGICEILCGCLSWICTDFSHGYPSAPSSLGIAVAVLTQAAISCPWNTRCSCYILCRPRFYTWPGSSRIHSFCSRMTYSCCPATASGWKWSPRTTLSWRTSCSVSYSTDLGCLTARWALSPSTPGWMLAH